MALKTPSSIYSIPWNLGVDKSGAPAIRVSAGTYINLLYTSENMDLTTTLLISSTMLVSVYRTVWRIHIAWRNNTDKIPTIDTRIYLFDFIFAKIIINLT